MGVRTLKGHPGAVHYRIAQRTGIWMMHVVPGPSFDTDVKVPLSDSTELRAMESPSPSPPEVSPLLVVKNGSKTCACRDR